jgi:four helix bundle protein
MQDFHNLKVWQKAHALVLHVYVASKELPASENFGLIQHLRRAATTIPRTIAEGTGREFGHEFALDLRKARAAGHELEYVFLLCRDLGFFAEPIHDELLAELIDVRRMISGLLPKLSSLQKAEA